MQSFNLSIKQLKKNNNKEDTILLHKGNYKQAKTLLTESASSYADSMSDVVDTAPLMIWDGGRHVLLIKMKDEKNEVKNLEAFRVAGSKAWQEMNRLKLVSTCVDGSLLSENELTAFCEGILLSSYSFKKYLAKPKKEYKYELSVLGKIDVKELQNLCTAVCNARDLVNEPYNKMDVSALVKAVKKTAKNSGLKVEVFNKKKIESLQMGGLLGVNQGSKQEPAFIILEHKPESAKNKQPLVFVGKGVVYDTGGASLKPSAGMMTMKCDMAGAAAVIGTMEALALNEVPVYAIGLIPATDNFIDNTCLVPGDIIHMSNGKSVEVLNTDAEGRLILADALHYASKLKPALVIDLATLTGAAVRAIGDIATAAMQVDADTYTKDLETSAASVYERIVWFPMWEEYGEMMKSDIADIKNLGPAEAGQITAAKFLEHFVSYPWIHLDIAGPAFLERNGLYRGKGATGTGIRTLYHFTRNCFITKK